MLDPCSQLVAEAKSSIKGGESKPSVGTALTRKCLAQQIAPFVSGFRTQIEGTFWTLGKQPGPRWSSRWCCCLVIKWRSSNTEGRQSSIKKLQVTLLLTIQLQSYLKICWIQRVFSKGTYQARPCCSHGRTLLQRFTGHVVYENLMSFLIVANSLVLGLQALSLSWDCLWASQIWSNFSL